MSLENLPDVWTTRDYPVLREVCLRIDSEGTATVADIEQATQLSPIEVSAAIAALRRQGYVTQVDGDDDGIVAVIDVNGPAYRVVGLHPDFNEDLAQLLITRLHAAADETSDEGEKSRIRRIIELFGDVSKDVTAGVVSSLIASGLAG